MIVHLSHSASLMMLAESKLHLPNETGGILIGRFQENSIEIIGVTGPGPEALHQPSNFRRDGTFSQQHLDALYVAHSGRYDYAGEWHSHPRPGGPSPQDRKSMKWIATNPAYNIENPLLVIYERGRRGIWQLKCYHWNGRSLSLLAHAITL